jgi:hypothetical protein
MCISLEDLLHEQKERGGEGGGLSLVIVLQCTYLPPKGKKTGMIWTMGAI